MYWKRKTKRLRERELATQTLHITTLEAPTLISASSPSYLSVAPQLVAFHAVAVVQGDGAVVGNGIEANFFRVHGVAHPNVLSPAKRKHLQEI